jgi:hypothetical protein
MSDRPTPETDEKASPHIGFFSCATVPAEFARKLERERDDANYFLNELAELSPDRGEPIMRRLKEFSKVVEEGK